MFLEILITIILHKRRLTITAPEDRFRTHPERKMGDTFRQVSWLVGQYWSSTFPKQADLNVQHSFSGLWKQLATYSCGGSHGIKTDNSLIHVPFSSLVGANQREPKCVLDMAKIGRAVNEQFKPAVSAFEIYLICKPLTLLALAGRAAYSAGTKSSPLETCVFVICYDLSAGRRSLETWFLKTAKWLDPFLRSQFKPEQLLGAVRIDPVSQEQAP